MPIRWRLFRTLHQHGLSSYRHPWARRKQTKYLPPKRCLHLRCGFSTDLQVLSSGISQQCYKLQRPVQTRGTALITAGSTTGRITKSIQDPMGRWCATSYLGAKAKIVTVMIPPSPPGQKSPKPQRYCQNNGSCVPTTSNDSNSEPCIYGASL
jgi:hypothetical protein